MERDLGPAAWGRAKADSQDPLSVRSSRHSILHSGASICQRDRRDIQFRDVWKGTVRREATQEIELELMARR
jgi:hypothetical protein